MHPSTLKKEVIRLRKIGKTYGEIRQSTGVMLSKGTLSDWCNGILLSQLEKEKVRLSQLSNMERGRETAWIINKARRKAYLASIETRIEPLKEYAENRSAKKIALAMLYLGEGKKINASAITLGNSDPKIIKIFLSFLRSAYVIDEKKLHCTLQCRADQDIKILEKFWSECTKVPLERFYKTRIDARTIGKPSRKLDYKGVCVINYFSADVFWEVMMIGELLAKGL